MPKLFSDLGYGATMFSPSYANFSWTPDLSIFIPYTNIKAYNQNIKYIPKDEITKFNNIKTEKEVDYIISIRTIKFSLFRVLPTFIRYVFYGNSGWHIPNDDNFLMLSANASINDYLYLISLPSMTTTHSNGSYFNILHNDITHEPWGFNDNYKASGIKKDVPKEDLEFFGSDFSARSYYAHVASLELLEKYFDYLKENNVYDNTKIIIVSDHGNGWYAQDIFNDELGKMTSILGSRHSLLLVKDFNSKEKLKINTNFMTVAEVPYLATRHLENPTNPFTGKIITNDQKNDGVIITEHDWVPNKRYDFTRIYKVHDNIFDKNNWEEIEIK